MRWLSELDDDGDELGQDKDELLRKLIIRLESKSTNYSGNLLIPFWLTRALLLLHLLLWPTKFNCCSHIMCFIKQLVALFSFMNEFFSSSLVCYNFFLCKYLTSLLSLHFSTHTRDFFPSCTATLHPPLAPKIVLNEARGEEERESVSRSSKKKHIKDSTELFFFNFFPLFSLSHFPTFRFYLLSNTIFIVGRESIKSKWQIGFDWKSWVRPRYD